MSSACRVKPNRPITPAAQGTSSGKHLRWSKSWNVSTENIHCFQRNSGGRHHLKSIFSCLAGENVLQGATQASTGCWGVQRWSNFNREQPWDSPSLAALCLMTGGEEAAKPQWWTQGTPEHSSWQLGHWQPLQTQFLWKDLFICRCPAR